MLLMFHNFLKFYFKGRDIYIYIYIVFGYILGNALETFYSDFHVWKIIIFSIFDYRYEIKTCIHQFNILI